MSDEVSVALVGCGIIAYNHANAIARIPGVKITALVDVNEAASSFLAHYITSLDEPTPTTFESLASALEAGVIDLVVICAPSGLHVSLAEEALAAGCNVVIEKPLDVSLPRARQIAALAEAGEARGLVVTVISQHRFDPASVVVHDAVTAGVFGRLTSGIATVAWWRGQAYYDSADWRGTWELDGGGAALNQGVHTIDLLLWMFGAPVSVSAQTALLAHDRIEVEDTLAATVTFESGALAVILATTAAYPELGTRLQVHGVLGSAVIENDQLQYFHASAFDREGNQAATLVPEEELATSPKAEDSFIVGHLRQYEDIVGAIREHRAPLVRVTDALLALSVTRALYLSATLGRSVLVAEVLDGSLDDVEVRTGGAA